MFSLRPLRSRSRREGVSVGRSGPAATRSRWVVLLALVVALSAGVLSAPVAQAHAALRSSNPSDGSVVVNLPPKVELVFNENIDPNLAAQVVLVDAAGATTRLESTVNGPSVSASLPRDLAPGQTAVRYRVVSADSHPVAGEVTFTFRPATASPTAAETTPGSATPGATSGAQPGAPKTITATSPAAESTAGNDGAYMMLALGGIGALVFGVIVFLLLRSDRRR